jgi:hypothetical protein
MLNIRERLYKINEELSRKLRAKVVEVKGNKKGALSEVIEEDIKHSKNIVDNSLILLKLEQFR